MPDQPFVSIIIPVFHNYRHLLNCFSALENQSYPSYSYEIIIVDDNHTNERIGSIIKYFRNFRYCISNSRGSYAARNIGIKTAKGELLAFTDSDCTPNHNWIENGVNSLMSHDDSIIGGNIEFYFKNQNFPSPAEVLDSISFMQQKHNIEKINFSVTANLILFKNVFNKVGLFNESLRSGGDFEWSQRASSAGYNFFYSKNTVVKHPARDSFLALYKKTIRTSTGVYNINKQKKRSSFSNFMSITTDISPPIRRLKKIL